MSSPLKLTPIEEIPKIRDSLRATFKSGLTRPIIWRRRQLLQLARLAQENAKAFADAILKDLGRPHMETYFTEIGPVVERSIESAKVLDDWAAPETVQVPDWQKSWSPTIHRAPKGVALIICPWNYPLILTLQPLMGAISAGCCAMLKLSEMAPAYATLLTELLPKYLDPFAYQILNAEVEGTTAALILQWDHIFYTGNGTVARIVAAAAAKHITPCTLELGGKSPIIIASDADLDLAAKRILFGKISNSGQICVSPDYALINRERQDAFVQALARNARILYPQGALNSDSYSSIINSRQHERLENLLKNTGGKIVVGGQSNAVKIEPTIIQDLPPDDALLGSEIFGPLLPIVAVDSLQEAIAYVNARPHPLVLYAFTQDEKIKQQIIEETTSGGLCFNDTFQQLAVSELPFGGVGESGYGRQFMRATFEEFSYTRSTVDIPASAENFLAARYPEYTSGNFEILAAAALQTIPDIESLL